MFRPGRWYLWLRELGRFFAHPLLRYAVAWLLALAIVGWVVAAGWGYFNNSARPDGNDGHTSIDFGGQWTMGRMLVIGQGDYLYERRHQRVMLRESYLEADQEPRENDRSDADKMMSWFMGSDNSTLPSCLSPLGGQNALEVAALIAAGLDEAWQPAQMDKAARVPGGPLYPPINAFWMYPLALSSPQDGYRIHQMADVVVMLLAAWGIALLSRGRLWLPVVLALMPLYPGFHGSHLLGQNSLLTLAILVWGWVLISRERPVWGGLVWGLLAFKPVWALSFFLVLLLSRRWRGAATMATAGVVQIAITLPVVGLHSWLEWLHIGKEAAELYNVDGNWIPLSRDLLSIPRRWMLDFEVASKERDTFEATVVSWGLLLAVFAVLAVLSVWKRRQIRATEGPSAAFLLLGGWLCCYHFMYYDVLLSFLPLMLLFTDSGWRVRTEALAPVPLLWQASLLRPWSVLRGRAGADRFRATVGQVAMLWLPSPRSYGWLVNPLPVLALVLLLGIEGPFRLVGPYVMGALADLVKEVLGIEKVPFRDWFRFSDKGTPWSTLTLLLLWLWCGWRLIRADAPTRQPTLSTLPSREEHRDGVTAATFPVEVDALSVTALPAR